MNRLLPCCSVLLLATAASATDVSGDITTTTWTAANSPYRVTDAIRVPSGNTLTINPGVDVLFDKIVPFKVQGAVHALGTETDSIRFLKGAADEWRGIRLSGGDSSSFRYARISDGHADGLDWDRYGGGICSADSGTRAYMDHCTISRSRAPWGGGLAATNSSRMVLNECTIRDNTAYYTGGGAEIVGLAAATAVGCVIRDNHAGTYGGGLEAKSSSPTILTNCTVVGNHSDLHAGGIYNESSELTLNACEITGNSAANTGGGLMGWNSTSALNDCVVDRNTAGADGGGLFGSVANIQATGCRITRNVAATNGGGLRCSQARVTLANCTVAGNTASQGEGACISGSRDIRTTLTLTNAIVSGTIYKIYYYASITATYSCTADALSGTGNISADPLFVDPANGDYHLQWGSPCIDAGDPALTDPDGTRLDIGTFAYPHGVGVSTETPAQTTLLPNTPNPFNPSTTIHYTLADAGPVSLVVYNTLGQQVRTLVNGSVTAGAHSVVWDGLDDRGKAVASGVYLHRLVSGGTTLVKRMTLVR